MPKKKSKGTSASELAEQYRERAKAEREAGGSCAIGWALPDIQITMSNGEEFYYQEHQADQVLDEAKKDIRESGMEGLVSVQDYLLAVYQNA